MTKLAGLEEIPRREERQVNNDIAKKLVFLQTRFFFFIGVRGSGAGVIPPYGQSRLCRGAGRSSEHVDSFSARIRNFMES